MSSTRVVSQGGEADTLPWRIGPLQHYEEYVQSRSSIAAIHLGDWVPTKWYIFSTSSRLQSMTGVTTTAEGVWRVFWVMNHHRLYVTDQGIAIICSPPP